MATKYQDVKEGHTYQDSPFQVWQLLSAPCLLYVMQIKIHQRSVFSQVIQEGALMTKTGSRLLHCTSSDSIKY